MNEYYAGKATESAQSVQAARDAADGVVRERFTDTLDRHIAELGKPWEGVFGAGSASMLGADSEHFANRQKLTDEMDIIEAGREALGMEPLPFRDAFQKALASAFSEQTKGTVRKEIASTIRDKQGRFSQRPTQREAQDLNPESAREKAVATARQRMAQLGKAG